MKHVAWTKRKSALTLTLCAIIATSTIIILQNTQTTQAALIVPHPGLVGWWRFDEGTGTMAGDSSGNGNNGTIYGATWTSGKYGTALGFDGVSNDYVSMGTSTALDIGSNDFSIFAWINIPASLSDTGRILDKGGGWGNKGYALRVTSSRIVEFFWNDGVDHFVDGKSQIPLGSWVLIGVTASRGGNVQCYLNGVPDGNPATMSTTSLANGLSCFVGEAFNTGEKFKGSVDEVRLYNRVLSATDIQADFQNGPDFSSYVLAKVPQGTTQMMTTLSWQGTGSINVTITSPSQTYTESMMSEYQKTSYSTSGGMSSMLNIKRLSVSVSALTSDQNWNITLTFDNPVAYQITVEVQK